LSVVSVVFCQVEFSTHCTHSSIGVLPMVLRRFVCDLETSWIRRPWPPGGLLRQINKNSDVLRPWGDLETITVTWSGLSYTVWQFVYILSVFLQSMLMMVAEATETCKWLIIRVKTHFTSVN
jgi:hypothetical protein